MKISDCPDPLSSQSVARDTFHSFIKHLIAISCTNYVIHGTQIIKLSKEMKKEDILAKKISVTEYVCTYVRLFVSFSLAFNAQNELSRERYPT